jgi:hypothetical protein
MDFDEGNTLIQPGRLVLVFANVCPEAPFVNGLRVMESRETFIGSVSEIWLQNVSFQYDTALRRQWESEGKVGFTAHAWVRGHVIAAPDDEERARFGPATAIRYNPHDPVNAFQFHAANTGQTVRSARWLRLFHSRGQSQNDAYRVGYT